ALLFVFILHGRGSPPTALDSKPGYRFTHQRSFPFRRQKLASAAGWPGGSDRSVRSEGEDESPQPKSLKPTSTWPSSTFTGYGSSSQPGQSGHSPSLARKRRPW